MITLPEIKPILNKIETISKSIEACDGTNKLPEVPQKLKEEFCKKWGKPSEIKPFSIKLYTSDTKAKSFSLEDRILIKCASAVELYNIYLLYKNQLTEVFNSLALDTPQRNLVGEQKDLPIPLKILINNEINKISTIDSASKKRLEKFSTDSKSIREPIFGAYKGITRPDAFQPAVAKLFDLLLANSGYLDDVIKVLQNSNELTEELIKLIPIESRQNWTDGEWCLSILIWNRHVLPEKLTRPKADFSRLLVAGTARSAGSWDRRIANIRYALVGEGLSGGEATPELVKKWQAEFLSNPKGTESLAKHAVLQNAEGNRILQILEISNKTFGPEQIGEFINCLNTTGFTSSADIPNLFIKALAAKPFIILTGNSGTGKTKLAELFVQWLSGEAKGRHALVPVGADWTDNRNVLGFVNHLRLTKPEGGTDEIPIYQSTRILDLLLEASKNPSDPFFLILDEMNLSHVERYFADFLSALESNEAGLLLHREGRGLPRKLNGPIDVPEELALPSNFFVIGTVNVDETTYMFSPKVLDRANVLEFRLDDEATKKFLDAGGNRIKPIAAAPLGYAQSFLELSHRARSSENPLPLIGDSATLPPVTKISIESCNKVMQELFGLMQIRHQEFAFRTIVEIRSFLAVDYELTINKQGWDWKSAMDAQILQKILPKLHGSKRKIGVLLAALAKYCERAGLEEAREFFAKETAADAYHAANEKRENALQFPRSHNKLCEMIESVRRDQFVSFIQ